MMNHVLSHSRRSLLRKFSIDMRSYHRVVDLRSDTVTMPSQGMKQAAMDAPLGDDVMREDPTVNKLEDTMAEMFGKEAGIFVPTCSMANLLAIMSHCHTRAAEAIIGAESHISLWEGGNAANLGGVHTKQIHEDENAMLNADEIRDAFRTDQDDHWPETKLLCLENSHNMQGGVVLPPSYMREMGNLAKDLNIMSHVDGARIFNSAASLGMPVADLCEPVDSVAVCFSKGLGAPLGSILVGEKEFIRLARRARKRVGGGMRQAGMNAAMCLYAVQHNAQGLANDNARAKRIGESLLKSGCEMMRGGQIDTNIVYFSLPEDSAVTKEELCQRLNDEYGVKITGGYSKGGKMFRIVTHLDVDDEDVDHAIESLERIIAG